MKYKKYLQKLLLEKGAKKAKGLETYFFYVPENCLEDKEGFKYTISKITLEPELEVHCYRAKLDPNDGVKYLVIKGDEINNYKVS